MSGQAGAAAGAQAGAAVIQNRTGIRLLIVAGKQVSAERFKFVLLERPIAAWRVPREASGNTREPSTNSGNLGPLEPIAPAQPPSFFDGGVTARCYFNPSTNEHWQEDGFSCHTRAEAQERLLAQIREKITDREAHG